jgi:transposase
MGRIEKIYGQNVSNGSLFNIFHKISDLLKDAVIKINIEYKNAHVKYADETGWRNDGEGGYAWVFCSQYTTIFKFKNTRSGKVAKEVLGNEILSGYLVVDRYAGYNKIKIKIQYCYAHLLRHVIDLGKEFPDEQEVQIFVSHLGHQLSSAMHLHNMDIIDDEYYQNASKIKTEILRLTESKFDHLGIINIQAIFIENKDRLYHWVNDRSVPADNNKSERELRPTVIARKVSFGSQSEQGMKTRENLMTYLHTAKKRLKEKPLEAWFKEVLDKITKDPKCDLYALLPPALK